MRSFELGLLESGGGRGRGGRVAMKYGCACLFVCVYLCVSLAV